MCAACIAQVVFANAGCVPAFVRFSHSTTATTAFATVVDDALLRQADGVHTKHMMRLPGRVQRYLKITFLGHAGPEATGAPPVSKSVLWRAHVLFTKYV